MRNKTLVTATGHYRCPPLLVTITGHYYWSPPLVTTGHHHWLPPLVTTTWSPPLVTESVVHQWLTVLHQYALNRHKICLYFLLSMGCRLFHRSPILLLAVIVVIRLCVGVCGFCCFCACGFLDSGFERVCMCFLSVSALVYYCVSRVRVCYCVTAFVFWGG